MSEITSFARRLRELRDAAGLTQAQLAEKAGLHRQGIAKLENGEREPAWGTVRALARALGVTCSAFESEEAETTEEEPRPRGRPRQTAAGQVEEKKPARKTGKWKG
jgi:transcriptional regulator with XRE-family HTH domain